MDLGIAQMIEHEVLSSIPSTANNNKTLSRDWGLGKFLSQGLSIPISPTNTFCVVSLYSRIA
jgi:hypothetical protein